MHHPPIKPVLGRSLRSVVLIALLVSGCAYPSERVAPRFQTYRQSTGAILILMPEVLIFEQLPDGSRLFRDTQSLEAQRSVQSSILGELQQRRFTVRTVDDEAMQQPEYRAITSLFRSVNRSIQLHTFGPQIFPAKLEAFDYHLGSIAEVLQLHGVDALVVAAGFQTGSDQPKSNWLSIAVVEPEGRVIWYNVKGDPEHFDLQSTEGVSALVANTMVNFWERGS